MVKWTILDYLDGRIFKARRKNDKNEREKCVRQRINDVVTFYIKISHGVIKNVRILTKIHSGA